MLSDIYNLKVCQVSNTANTYIKQPQKSVGRGQKLAMSWAGRGGAAAKAQHRGARSLAHPPVRQVAPGGTLPSAVPGTPGTGTFPIGACYCNG